MQGLVTQFLSQGHCPCCSARCSRGRAGLLPGTTPRGAGAGALGGGVVTTPLQGADWLASRLKEFPPKHNHLHVSETSSVAWGGGTDTGRPTHLPER